MFGPLWFFLYNSVIDWRARWLSPFPAALYRARWAVWFYSTSSGGYDDDFATEIERLIDATPGLLEELLARTNDGGMFGWRRRLLLQVLRDNRLPPTG